MERKRRRIFKEKPVDVEQVIRLESKRARMFGQAVREIMDSEGLSWEDAKSKLIKELRFMTFKRRMFNLNTA